MLNPRIARVPNGVAQIVETEDRELGALGRADEPAVERGAADRLPRLRVVLEHERVGRAALAVGQQRGADVGRSRPLAKSGS
jgi:hypothetical protein